MNAHISRQQATFILLAIAVVGFAAAVFGYGYLISSNCGSSGVNEFFSNVQAFHTHAGC